MSFLLRLGPDHWLEIEEIIRRWHSYNDVFLKVETTDGRICVLRYEVAQDRYAVSLVPVRRGDQRRGLVWAQRSPHAP